MSKQLAAYVVAFILFEGIFCLAILAWLGH